MKRYKLLTQDGYADFNFKVGEIYGEHEIPGSSNFSVEWLVSMYPSDWQLIEKKQEKRPTMTYVILSIMMALYLYAGLWQINWPLIPATIMGFYLLFKNDRNGRKQVF